MNQCEAVVLELAGDDAWVEIEGRRSACAGCPTPDACSTNTLGQVDGKRRVKLPNPSGARPGDRVSLVMADGAVWRAAFLAYVLPLLLGLGGAALGDALATAGVTGIHPDMAALCGLAFGLMAGFAVLRRRGVGARGEAGGMRLVREGEHFRFNKEQGSI